MKALNIIGKRVAFGLATAWAVLTTVFLLLEFSSDWIAARIEGQIRGQYGPGNPLPPEPVLQAEINEALSEYMAERGLDRPTYERYIDWMTNMITLDWGESVVADEGAVSSYGANEEVFPLIMDATIRTGMYVVPAIFLAVLIGMAIGIYAATNPNSRLANTSRVSSYFLFAIPSFWIGGLFIGAVKAEAIGRHGLLFDHVLPIVLVAMTMLGGYTSYSRAHTLEQVSEEFVTLIRAKGAGPIRVTRHVVRNAAIPLFAMLFTEVLGLMILSIFVIEIVFGIQGLGLVFFEAIDVRDLPVLLGTTMVIIMIGVAGNVIQDLSYQYLDPRVEES